MPAEIEFSFDHLTRGAQQHIRVFQLQQFLDRFGMGLTVAVVALALLDRDMDLFQISLLFGVYSVTTMAMELPFGGLADNIGRKPVFLSAVVASLISMVIFLSTNDFYVLMLSFAFIGFGRALRSGTLDAWFIEKFRRMAPNVDFQPALAKAQWANAMGLAFGAICGGLLPDVFGDVAREHGFSVYDVSYAASLIMMTVLFSFTLVAIKEEPRPFNPNAFSRGFVNIPAVIKEASFLALKDPILSLLLLVMGLVLMATNPVEVYWSTHLKGMLDENYANTAIGVLTATYFFSIAFGAAMSPHLNRMFKRQNAVSLCVTFVCLAILQIVLAFQESIIGFVGLFVLFSIVLGAMETPASSILHSCVENQQRSTILSLRSLVQQLGAAIGLLVVGGLAESYSLPIAWIGGAGFLIIAVLIMGLLIKRSRS
jgi:MFS family permease